MRHPVKRKRRVLVVPALAGLGTLLIGYGHWLSLPSASLAAPLPAAAQAPAALPAGNSATGSATQGSPEFGGAAGAASPGPTDRIFSTTPDQLIREARENSGREDPFVALTLPEAHVIVPLPPPTPKPEVYIPPPPTPKPVQKKYVPGRGWITVPVVVHEAPQWTIQGILNTGSQQLVLLVDPDANTVSAGVGDVLPDGSRVVSITPQQVTLQFQGERYVKTIGGQVSP